MVGATYHSHEFVDFLSNQVFSVGVSLSDSGDNGTAGLHELESKRVLGRHGCGHAGVHLLHVGLGHSLLLSRHGHGGHGLLLHRGSLHWGPSLSSHLLSTHLLLLLVVGSEGASVVGVVVLKMLHQEHEGLHQLGLLQHLVHVSGLSAHLVGGVVVVRLVPSLHLLLLPDFLELVVVHEEAGAVDTKVWVGGNVGLHVLGNFG